MRLLAGPCCLFALASLAQQNDIPLQRDIYLDLERNAACRTSTVHSGLKPLIESRADRTNVMGHRPDSSRHYYTITEKLFKEHLIEVRDGGFHVTADPVFHFELGQDFRDPSEFADTTRFYVNSRGAIIRADLGPRFSFQTTFYENQAIYPRYLYDYAQYTGVVPGQGRIKGFKHRAFDYAWAMGNLSWSPRKWVNVQFGHGKQFVGHGYRSMLLSDNAFNHPYFKVSLLSPDEHWQYTTTTAKLQMLLRLPTGESSESLFYWKRATFHHLRYVNGPLELALFEATIWENIDSTGVEPFDPLAINPVIGVNTAVTGFEQPDNALVGLDARVKLTDKLYVYGQYAVDDPTEQRTAWQAGLRWFDLFGRDLHLQAEYNSAAPYTYSFAQSRVNYGHYGQPLAHPQGGNFNEALAILDWRIPTRGRMQLCLTAKAEFVRYRADTIATTSVGHDILRPVPQVLTTAGEDRHVTFVDLSAGWLMNQMTNMRLVVGYRYRDIDGVFDNQNSGYLYASWQTGLFNKYYDL